MTTAPELVDESTPREAARRRVERKHKFRRDVAAYVVINCMLIGVWAATGLGYFWPGWVLGGWGVMLILQAWSSYNGSAVSDEEVDRELHRGR